MDPYLEPFWGDLHASMMVYLRNALQSQLPEGLWARVEERITINYEETEEIPSQFEPDTILAESSPWATGGSLAAAYADVAEPFVISAGPRTARHLRIVDIARGERVVTVIEVLSPANKVGERGREAYRRKQDAYLGTSVNLIEIDLLRRGEYTLAAPWVDIPKAKLEAYLVSVFRSSRRRWELYPVSIRKSLPAFRIPLRSSDTDVILDLQSVFSQCYADGRYDRAVNYGTSPESAWDAADLTWISDLLKSKGLRDS